MFLPRLNLLTSSSCLKLVGSRSYASKNELAARTRPTDLYEPRIEMKKGYPCYPLLNIRLQSYDFVPLERFQAFAHRLAKMLKFTVHESIAVAGKSTKVQLFKPNSSTVTSEVDLVLYDRWIRLKDVPAVRLPLFALMLHAHAPVGTKIEAKVYEKTDETERYIPNHGLKVKQMELKQLDDPLVRRNLGWE